MTNLPPIPKQPIDGRSAFSDLLHTARGSINLQPADARRQLALARADLEAGQPNEALARGSSIASSIETADEAGGLADVVMASAFAVQGRAWAQLGEAERASAAFDSAARRLARERTLLEAPEWLDLGVALYETGRVEEAIDPLTTAANRGAPKPGEVSRYLGLALHAAGRPLEAEQHLRDATLVPAFADDAQVYEALAQAVGAGGRREEQAVVYADAAIALAYNNRFDEALAMTGRALAVTGEDARVLGIRGEILRMLGRGEEALAVLDRSLVLLPGDHSIMALKSRTLITMGRHAEAFAVLDEVLASDPTLRWAHIQRAESLVQLGRYEEALGALDAAAAVAPDDADLLVTRGRVLRLLNRLEEALPLLDRAVRAAPDDAFAVGTRGEVLSALGRPEEALADLDRAGALDPTLAWVHLKRAEVLLTVHGVEAALPAFDAAIEAAPDDPRALLRKGVALRTAGRLAEALPVLERAYELGPGNATVALELAECRRLMGALAPALSLLDAVLAVEPENAWAHGTRGQVLAALGRTEDALSELDEAVALDPALAWAHIERAGLLAAVGRREDASRAYDDASRLAPDDPYVLGRKGMFLRDGGDPEGGLALLQRALASSPESAALRFELGETLRLLARNDEALAALEGLDSDDPTERSTLLATRAQVLRALGRNSEALPLLHEAVAAVENPAAWVLLELAVALAAEGRLDEALNAVDLGIGRGPVTAFAWATRGEILAQQRRFDEALSCLDRAARLDEGSSYVLITRSNVLSDLGRGAEGAAAALEALEREPESTAALAALARAYLIQNRYEQAIEALDRVLAVDPNELWAYSTKAWALNDTAEFEAARALADDALGRFPGDPFLRAVRGVSLLMLGEGVGARQAMEAAIDADPSVLWWYGVLGEAQLASGDRQAAEESWRIVATRARDLPPDADDLALAGWCEYRLGNQDAAARLYLRSLSLNPAQPAVRFDLGLAYLVSDQGPPAVDEYLGGIDLLWRQPDARRQLGILYVARREFDQAMAETPALTSSPSTIEVDRLLADAARRVAEALAAAAGDGSDAEKAEQAFGTPVAGA